MAKQRPEPKRSQLNDLEQRIKELESRVECLEVSLKYSRPSIFGFGTNEPIPGTGVRI
jgi:hypothetical protein